MKITNKKILLWIGAMIIFAMACSATSPNNDEVNQAEENQTNFDSASANEENNKDTVENDPFIGYQEMSDTDFGKLLNSGAISLGGVTANSEVEDTFGEILTLQLTNPGTDEVIVSLPCGLVFVPSDSSNQRLMLVQPLDLTLAPGETQNPTPYVVCIDVAASAPGYDNTYSVGYLTDNELLMKFAECICNKEISTDLISMDGVGIQFATWSIGMGGDFSQTLEDNPGMADYFGQEYGDDIDGAITQLMDMISVFGNSWLEDCGIEVEN